MRHRNMDNVEILMPTVGFIHGLAHLPRVEGVPEVVLFCKAIFVLQMEGVGHLAVLISRNNWVQIPNLHPYSDIFNGIFTLTTENACLMANNK